MSSLSSVRRTPGLLLLLVACATPRAADVNHERLLRGENRRPAGLSAP